MPPIGIYPADSPQVQPVGTGCAGPSAQGNHSFLKVHSYYRTDNASYIISIVLVGLLVFYE
jgi:hypothetical protein